MKSWLWLLVAVAGWAGGCASTEMDHVQYEKVTARAAEESFQENLSPR